MTPQKKSMTESKRDRQLQGNRRAKEFSRYALLRYGIVETKAPYLVQPPRKVLSNEEELNLLARKLGLPII